MKQIIPAILLLVIVAGCKNETTPSSDTNKNLLTIDTAALSRSSILTDQANSNGLTVPLKNEPGTITTTTITTVTTKQGYQAPIARSVSRKATVPKARKNSNSVQRSTTSNSGSTASTRVVKRDKGWSDAAKGTAIGAGAGAVIGAILSKDKVKGAVIGGVIGGGGGYAIGRARDRKSGRVERSRQAKQVNYIY